MELSLYRVLCILLHIFHSTVQTLVVTWLNIRKKFEELLIEDLKDEHGFISEHVKLLQKIPTHVVVIIGNEQISCPDLANISMWCLAAGISFLSFYDHRGVLKRREPEVIKALSNNVDKEHLKNIVWGKNTSANGYSKHSSPSEENDLSSKLTLNIFSITDGKESFVDITHSLCESAMNGTIQQSNISQELISEQLYKKFGVPEPELAMVCGNTLSSYCFLPWHVRFTEFVQLPSHHGIKLADFVKHIDKYGQIQQRFGQ